MTLFFQEHVNNLFLYSKTFKDFISKVEYFPIQASNMHFLNTMSFQVFYDMYELYRKAFMPYKKANK